MFSGDTIAAISSAVGPAARMIVRISGPQSQAIASVLAELREGVSRTFVRLGGLEFATWIYSSHGRRSYTGEESVEFHIPGNPLLARMLLEELVAHGARHAEPGEFTARAYFNGRLDLAQAEGVAATIAASNDAELRGARQLLAGELARRVQPAMELLADTLALVEVGIDFSDEDVQFISSEQIHSRLDEIDHLLEAVLDQSVRLERLHHVPQIILIGRPNAGKSTLLNALAGEERAVVSPLAGTTRDALSAEITLARGIIRLIDVAGLDEPPTLDDPIASAMQKQAMQTLEEADRVILVRDGTNIQPDPVSTRAPNLVVVTKADLGQSMQTRHEGDIPRVHVSALTGQGMTELRRKIDELAFGTATDATFAINARHVESIRTARDAMARGKDRATEGIAELIAIELREALDALGAILGQVTPDDVLGRIFAGFCIGK